jgi:hypothetical protein
LEDFARKFQTIKYYFFSFSCQKLKYLAKNSLNTVAKTNKKSQKNSVKD